MSAPSRKLGSYEVGLSFLLLRFAEEAEIDEPLMGWLLQEVNAISTRGLFTLRQEMCRNEDGAEIWEILMSGLRSIDSPDALFDLFRSLESMICRELVSTSLMHSSGAFGQLARRLILSFKQASFEAIVKLYDSIQSVVMDFDDLDETNESMCSMGVDDLKSVPVPVSRSRSLPEIPLSVGRLPFAVINATVQMSKMRLPSSHMAFLQYVTSAQHRFVDSAESSLRSFYDGKKLERDKRDSLPVQNVQNVQNALLTLATLNLEMRHVDDAFQALEDSIRAAQETSDASCLCACLYLLSILLQSGSQSSPSMASMSSSMMQRCLERSEALGLPLLQCLCCMGIARSLTVQPETRQTKRASGSTELGVGSQTATGTLQTIQAVPSVSGMPTAATGSFGARMWGANGGNRQGSGLLTALSHGPTGGAAGREAFAHATMASLLSTAGSLQETRPKVLLCQAAISASFGLHSSARSTYKILLDTYRDSLTSEEHALALCQQLSPDESCLETLQKLKQELPHAGHVWVCSIMPKLCREMMSGSGSASNATAVDLEALVIQSAGALRAVPQSLASDALLGWRIATNETRLYQGQLQAAMAACQSYRMNNLHPHNPPSPELCKYLLNCCAIHLKAQNPAAALEPCMRCISIATKENLLDIKAEAQLMLARLKLEQQDFQVLEAEMHLGSAKLRGELHLMQAEAFLELLARSDQTESQKLLESIIEKLKLAVSNFQAANVSSQEFYGHSHYLLARCFHQMGDVNARDHHAREFRLSRQVSRPEGSTLYPMP